MYHVGIGCNLRKDSSGIKKMIELFVLGGMILQCYVATTYFLQYDFHFDGMHSLYIVASKKS
jgi:hypothetical protein